MKTIFCLFLSIFLTLIAYSSPSLVGAKNYSLPPSAPEITPNLYYLGERTDKDGVKVKGYAQVHPDSKNGKNVPQKGAVGRTQRTSCFEFMVQGAKWRTPENYLVYGVNQEGIAPETLLALAKQGVSRWEDAADGKLGNGKSKDIVGEGFLTTDPAHGEFNGLDYENEIFFSGLDGYTLGVTIVWGVFEGKIGQREIREWDQVYNSNYEWSAESQGIPGKMDFANVVTHELGHVMGLGDLYTPECTQETMYGVVDFGETIKRDLNPGDVAGIRELYR